MVVVVDHSVSPPLVDLVLLKLFYHCFDELAPELIILGLGVVEVDFYKFRDELLIFG